MRNIKRHIGLGRHLVTAACLLFVLASNTSAYSIVMRGGKRIEIPEQFSVTKMTLTYEAAPGFWITLQMAAVDIPATERANNEKPGSLLGRVTLEVAPSPRNPERKSQTLKSRASRTVTNRDLESFREVRLRSERAYDERQKEQGLPTLAVMRAQAAEDAKRLAQELALQRAEAEARERDAQLQAQIAALTAQLNSLQSSSGGTSYYSPDAFGYYGGVPFYGGRSRGNRGLFRVPLGFQIGGAFGSINGQFGSPFRRQIIVAPGSRLGGHGGSRGGNVVGPRSR